MGGFRRLCLQAPYAANSERCAEVKAWFDELYARRDTDGLELSFRQVSPQKAYPFGLWRKAAAFNAFCLNDQMYFSDRAGVLALPYVCERKDPAHRPERLIGVWLHDFGKADVETSILFLQGYAKGYKTQAYKQFPFHIKNIVRHVGRELKKRYLPGGRANRWSWHYSLAPEARVTVKNRVDVPPVHRDTNYTRLMFRRIVSHALWHTGTCYLSARTSGSAFCARRARRRAT
ncbi:MAG: hypothetical protein KGI97_08305 [Alphaproteobacteria bacterium]|nr:hypothetical protein [Alphaproteobacteria bacterium]